MDIENIHVMRSSLHRLKSGLTLPNYVDELPRDVISKRSAEKIEMDNDVMSQSAWKVHLCLLLKGAIAIAESLMLAHPVLIHCSDGWDRTSQLSSLTQILLDPYYRTFEGFLALIMKDWCAFGHKLGERIHTETRRWVSAGKPDKDNSRGIPSNTETSPVFLQFLDCVYQMHRQFPYAFEFSAH